MGTSAAMPKRADQLAEEPMHPAVRLVAIQHALSDWARQVGEHAKTWPDMAILALKEVQALEVLATEQESIINHRVGDAEAAVIGRDLLRYLKEEFGK